jgi:hypothetical protein
MPCNVMRTETPPLTLRLLCNQTGDKGAVQRKWPHRGMLLHWDPSPLICGTLEWGPRCPATYYAEEYTFWSRALNIFFFGFGPWQAGRRYSREFSESGIRAFQCYVVPQLSVVAQVGRAESETRRCSGNCHARRHPKVLLDHIED